MAVIGTSDIGTPDKGDSKSTPATKKTDDKNLFLRLPAVLQRMLLSYLSGRSGFRFTNASKKIKQEFQAASSAEIMQRFSREALQSGTRILELGFGDYRTHHLTVYNQLHWLSQQVTNRHTGRLPDSVFMHYVNFSQDPIKKVYRPHPQGVLILTQNGMVYALGDGLLPHVLEVPTLVPGLEDIVVKDIQIFGTLPIFITDQAKIFVWELDKTLISIPELEGKKIIKAISKADRLVLLTEEGDVFYSLLENQAADNYMKLKHLPIKDIPNKITDVFLASSSIFLRTDKTELFEFVANDSPKSPTKIVELTGVNVLDVVTLQEKSSRWHEPDLDPLIFFIADKGVHFRGFCGHQLEVYAYNELYISKPFPIERLKNVKITKIIGDKFNVFFLSNDGDVYVCGKNRHGELGLGDLQTCSSPQKISFFHTNKIAVRDILYDGQTAQFVCDTDEVYVCGKPLEDVFILREEKASEEEGPGPLVGPDRENHLTGKLLVLPTKIKYSIPLLTTVSRKDGNLAITSDGEIYGQGIFGGFSNTRLPEVTRMYRLPTLFFERPLKSRVTAGGAALLKTLQRCQTPSAAETQRLPGSRM